MKISNFPLFLQRPKNQFLIVLLIISAIFATTLTKTTVSSYQPVDAVQYSRVILALFAICIVYNIICEYRLVIKNREELLKEKEEVTPEKKQHTKQVRILVVVTLAVQAFFCVAFSKLGYYATSLIVLLVYMMTLYHAQNGALTKRDVLRIVLLSLVICLLLYVVFSVLFRLWLPDGLLI